MDGWREKEEQKMDRKREKQKKDEKESVRVTRRTEGSEEWKMSGRKRG